MARLAVTVGDPAGIGPEVLVKTLAAWAPPEVLVIGDAATWAAAQRIAGVTVPARPADRPGPASAGVPFLDLPPADRSWRLGEMSPAAGRAAAQWLEHAVRLALDGAADAVVFAPLNKEALMRAGYPVRDEYDLVASLAGAAEHDEVNVIPHPGGGDLLWVARVTSHAALREVASLLSMDRVLRTVRLAHRVAAAAGTRAPRIGVAAFNPHAGEGGLLGDEEIRVIRPAVEKAAAEGIDASGPHPADHVFRRARAGAFDAVVAMYHDQAQIATKLLGFERGVSVGVGYPFVLATPSHGTAFDMAGTGVADPSPMAQALRLAWRLADAGFRI
ncbi:MAG: 4-hydroxythreonine-4-phosphate dehydrogenase PdxA [Armatimonadota bacterium]|nr:4-hydroxythreonine-4-phosphate dehydrogenase PdxA [Armatimonadota bacterium]MDR7520477.1 4-hydroxythreonine-4-phosphate dehydrogenase PdxA [Armatimonadota bacterium]MDR7548943.1 4-hydroxythreonine-4-phosphate dehydrogenase PdxA [Armatimonadota bacterium]